MRKTLLATVLLSASLFTGCSDLPESKAKFTGSYLGLEYPDSVAKIFAPGFINRGLATRDITFSPDGKEIFFCASIGNHTYTTILFTKELNGQWTEPSVAPFAQNPEYMYIEPHFSPDGSHLYFASDQPNPGDTSTVRNSDIWFVERAGDSWGEPVNLGAPVNSDAPEFFPSLTKNRTLYFTRDDQKSGVSYIFRSEFRDGKYQDPELLPEQINAGRSRFNAFVAPDESYIIVPIFGLPDSYGGTDYYISFHKGNDNWTNPLHLGKNVNSESRFEYSASVSPDGKFLFFMSSARDNKKTIVTKYQTINDLVYLHNQAGNGNSCIYWTDASAIQKLRALN